MSKLDTNKVFNLLDQIAGGLDSIEGAIVEIKNQLFVLSEPDATRTWSERSLKSMEGVHNKLRVLANDVLQQSPLDIMIIEGMRSKERQRELVNRGASQTMRSYHLVGRALDFVPIVDGEVSWHWNDFNQVGPVWEACAKNRGIAITWGGRWKNFPDGAHVQLEPYEEDLF